MLCYGPGNKDIQVYLLLVLKSLIFTFSLKKDKPTLFYIIAWKYHFFERVDPYENVLIDDKTFARLYQDNVTVEGTIKMCNPSTICLNFIKKLSLLNSKNFRILRRNKFLMLHLASFLLAKDW